MKFIVPGRSRGRNLRQQPRNFLQPITMGNIPPSPSSSPQTTSPTGSPTTTKKLTKHQHHPAKDDDETALLASNGNSRSHPRLILHEALVRERDAKHHSLEDIFEVKEQIGHGGLCTIYKIVKKQSHIGGSARPTLVRKKRRRRPHQFLIKRAAQSAPALLLAKTNATAKDNTNVMPALPSKNAVRRVKSEDEGSSAEEEEEEGEESDDKNNNDEEQEQESEEDGGTMNFALKVINLALVQETKIDQLRNEVEILKALDHKNIIKAYETFDSGPGRHTSQKLMIVMELCTGGDLASRIPYTEPQASRTMKQVLSAVSYLHHKNIVHRDLKLENIMFESPHPDAAVKVIDFGLSKVYESSAVLTERVGTLYSMSPGTLKGKYTKQADLWSLGVCTYMLLANGDKPFVGKTPKEVVGKILRAEYTFGPPPQEESDDHEQDNPWDRVSETAKDFVRALLVVEPAQRLTAEKAKAHEWIRLNGQQPRGGGGHDYSHRSSSSSLRRTTSGSGSEDGDDAKRISTPDPPGHYYYQGNPYTTTAEYSSGRFPPSSPVSPHQEEQRWKRKVLAGIIDYANNRSEFRKLALNVIAKKSTSDQIYQIRRVFEALDTQNCGYITLAAFNRALESQFDDCSADDVQYIFRQLDVNRTNVINYTEFLAAALETQGAIAEYRLAEAFDLMDSDDSGFISRENLRQIFGGRADEQYIDSLLKQATGSDDTRRGKISYQDFLSVFDQRPQEPERQSNGRPEEDGKNNDDTQEPTSTEEEMTKTRRTSTESNKRADEVIRKNGFIKNIRRAVSSGNLAGKGVKNTK